ncbi:endo-N-acetylneuraminidase [Klebsiella pneumoniae]|nr:endo-N-acetylneuraminidase [Klebsiella pneumoniae]
MVENDTSSVEYQLSTSTGPFSIPFYFIENGHIVAELYTQNGDDFNKTTLTIDVDYYLNGAGDKNGGQLTLLSAHSGATLLIYRDPDATQLTSYLATGKFPATSHERALDKLTMLIQKFGWWWDSLALKKPNIFANYYDALNNRIRNLRDPSLAQDAATKSYVDSSDIDLQQQITSNFNRSLRVPDSYISQLPSAQDRAWKGLGFDGAGQPKLQDPAGTGLWGYVPAIGSFEQGSLLTQRFEVLLWESTDEYWRWDGVMPKVVLPGSTPATAGGTGKGKWIDVTDATLRANLGSSEIPGTSLVTHSDGVTVERHLNVLNRRTSFVMPEDFPGTDTEQLLAANSYAKANSVNFQLQPGKTYVLTGSVGLDIDLGYFSFGCAFGRAGIDATGFTGDAAIWVHSSAPYSLGYRVHSNIMRGVSVVGSLKGTGQAGIITGNKNNNANGTYNGDCNTMHCSFKNFDKLLLATNSTWRYKFTDCGFTTELTGTTHALHFPAGLLDSGESISFDNCKIYDTKGAKILLECANFAIGMSGTSILNCPVEITGAGALINLDKTSNIENPVASAWYRYVKVTGVGARFNFNGCTIVCNNPSVQTQPLFEVGPNAFLDFSHVKMPGNHYLFQNGTEGLRTFVEGDGYVIATSVIADIASGAGNIPLHKSLNPTRNSGFETGDLSSWSFNNQGSASQTCVVGTAYKKTGTYGARMTSFGSLSCFLTQNVKVTQHNYYTATCQINTITAGTGTTAGALTVTFYDRAGNAIQSGASSSFTNTPSGWQSVGQFIQGRVPQAAEYCEVSIRCREGAVIDVDNFIINFT